MKIKLIKSLKPKNEVLAFALTEEQVKKAAKVLPKEIVKEVVAVVKADEYKGEEASVLSTYINVGKSSIKVILVGLGKEKELESNSYRNAGGLIGKQLKDDAQKAIVSVQGMDEKNIIDLTEGLLYAQYKFDKFKTKKKGDKKKELETLSFYNDKTIKGLATKLEQVQIIVEGAEMIRDLVNSPSNVVDSDEMAKVAKKVAKENKYKIEILTEKDLVKQKWGALLAVNQGSGNEARCVVLRYFGAKSKSEKPVVLVGKGVTFDTGGYNIKPTGYMEDMHTDMGGAATVMGVFHVLAELGIKKNVVGVMPLVENMVSSTAYKPSDMITSLSGKTIHVTNTDAEGRLILADALTYATKQKPQEIFSIATLTGAALSALGDRYTALVSNKKEIVASMKTAGDLTDDLCWELPLHKEFTKNMKSDIADLHNYDKATGRLAGTAKAAAFLQEFVDKNDWCHMDIAGTAYISNPKPYQAKGAVAGGYRALVEYLMSA